MGKIIPLMYRSYEIVGKIEHIKKGLEITKEEFPLSYTINKESNRLVVICSVDDFFSVEKMVEYLNK